MFEWLKKVMAGDHSVEPEGEVTRDEQGRITQVKQTISAGQAEDAPERAKLELSDALTPRIGTACEALWEKNLSLARTYGIGQEVNFSYDQDDGKLVLVFEDGRKIITRGQMLGSFDPHDRSFMWGWANPSFRDELKTDAEAVKAEGERLGEAALTTAIQGATFNELQRALALALEICGADGVYRCIVNGSTSLFMSVRVDEMQDANGGVVDADAFFGGKLGADMLSDAASLAAQHHADMFALDKAHHDAKEAGTDNLREIVDKKTDIYNRDWSRDDDYWLPSSIGWPSDHDPAEHKLRATLPALGGGALDIALKKMVGGSIYKIERVGDALKITDQLLNWGDGFIWPDKD